MWQRNKTHRQKLITLHALPACFLFQHTLPKPYLVTQGFSLSNCTIIKAPVLIGQLLFWGVFHFFVINFGIVFSYKYCCSTSTNKDEYRFFMSTFVNIPSHKLALFLTVTLPLFFEKIAEYLRETLGFWFSNIQYFSCCSFLSDSLWFKLLYFFLVKMLGFHILFFRDSENERQFLLPLKTASNIVIILVDKSFHLSPPTGFFLLAKPKISLSQILNFMTYSF